MKILIVDDEELTRTGVISSIDWQALGIQEIFQADDGVHGLEIALREHPEIVLCDVRMPRMDGIAMFDQISGHFPDTTGIFMSGYSDKEYLMAAIKLKAVNYIEKPINKAELESTLQKAVALHAKKLRSQHVEVLHSRESGSRLAHLLTVPGESHLKEAMDLLEDLAIPPEECDTILTMLVQLDASADLSLPFVQEIISTLYKKLEKHSVHLLSETRRHQYLVFTFLSNGRLSQNILDESLAFLKEQLAHFSNYYITLGQSQNGLNNAHSSYEEAVILMQRCYFFDTGTILSSEEIEQSTVFDMDFSLPNESEFSKALNALTANHAAVFLQKLYQTFHENGHCLPNQVKDLYYKLFYTLEDARIQHQLLSHHDGDIAVSLVEKCFSYTELHRELSDRVNTYFHDLNEQSQENPTILLIKDYISQNFSKETLSVKEISEYVYLSTSYVCTFFKNETGKTLNQYITDFRIEKAKQLLDDPRYRISNISSKVGYSDGNYFGKIFKKHIGVSPSEFRERKSL